MKSGGLLLALAVLLGACGPALPRSTPSPSAELPPPQPVATGRYQVGVYYFPGWPTYEKWSVLNAFPERVPLLGYYQEGHPAVMDWQIKWAVEHGISFFVFDWYWDRGQRQLEHALHDGYLPGRFRRFLKFCLLWANHNAPGSSSEPDLLAVLDYWLQHYLREPEYLRVDGKPVVIIFSPARLREDMGSSAVRAAFERMRLRARGAGLAGLFIVGAAVPGRDGLAALKAEGYDAGTGYNYPRAGMAPEDGLRAPYDTAVDGYEQMWRRIAAEGVLDYVPVAEPGWDSRPWDGDRALVRTGRHPAKFREMLRRARAFVDQFPLAGDKKLVLVEAWNEYGEGAAVEPHREWGFRYLDAIREVFGEATGAHADQTPEELGFRVPQVPCPGRPCPPLPSGPVRAPVTE